MDNYLNVRDQPSEDGNIIGKMTSKSAGEILETSEDGGWYKIQSGPVTGYVKAEYIPDRRCGEAGGDGGCRTDGDRFNRPPECPHGAEHGMLPIWTQISNNERYDVISPARMAGVEIALDTTSAYVATDFRRCALWHCRRRSHLPH